MKTQEQSFSWTDGHKRPEIQLLPTETDGRVDDQMIMCGYVPVVLMKMFGPLIFADIRIRAEQTKCEWIVERMGKDGWVEVVRIPGQVDDDFED